MAYTTAAHIRALEDAFRDATEFPDADLTGYCTLFAQPTIDGALRPAGFDVPFTDESDILIQSIAAKLTCAMMLSGQIANVSVRDTEKAEALEKAALGDLEKLAKHELECTHERAGASDPAIYDSNPLVRPSHERFVNGYENWTNPTEERAT